MFTNLREKITLSGMTVLGVGVALLIFTFMSAYGFLTQNPSITASEDLIQTFGEALAPLIATCVRLMYLGVMGWVGSLLTIRGVTILVHAPKAEIVAVPSKAKVIQQKAAAAPQKVKLEPQKEPKPETESKPSEPEMVVMPPEEMAEQKANSQQPQPSS
ncbi:MAG: hypothetical protein ACUVTE_05605 [Candidatus Bathycorpusculaceae bacterium]